MICELSKCTGCYSCYNICPKNCINMEPDDFGFIYPNIDMNKCIECNLCRKSCPVLNDKELKRPKSAYAAWALDNIERDTSTSGGAASIFSRYIIRNGGVVFGATVDSELNVKHIKVSNELELNKLKGSKYVHSRIESTYKECLKELKNNRKVLFTGTPCQIDGLKNFLKKDYRNLYTLDIICHGVPSQKYLDEYIDQVYGKRDYDNISFRDNGGFNFKLKRGNEEKFIESMNDNLYYIGFMQSLFYRENCYKCRYATSSRISDITIGDFWGLAKEKEFKHSTDGGVSVLLPITDKGMELISECKEYMFIEEREVSEAINGNDQLRHPSIMNKNYDKFRKIYIKCGFIKASKKSLQSYIIKRDLKNSLKKNEYIYKIVKKIKK